MDYPAKLIRQPRCWVLTFPDMPQHTVVAQNCNELLEGAAAELNIAICKYFRVNHVIPTATAAGELRVESDLRFRMRLTLITEIWNAKWRKSGGCWTELDLDEPRGPAPAT